MPEFYVVARSRQSTNLQSSGTNVLFGPYEASDAEGALGQHYRTGHFGWIEDGPYFFDVVPSSAFERMVLKVEQSEERDGLEDRWTRRAVVERVGSPTPAVA